MHIRSLNKIKRALCFALFYSGLIYLLRYIIYKIYGNPIIVLYIHRIVDRSQEMYSFLLKQGHLDIDDYETKVKYLAKKYNIISLQECLEYIKDRKPRPKNSVVITFDDGHHDLYRNAYPILKKEKIPATIFLTTGLIDSNDMTWFDKRDYIIFQTKVSEFQIKELSDKVYSLSSDDERIKTVWEIGKKLKEHNRHNINKILENMSDKLKVNPNESNNRLMLSWKEILEMENSGLITFGSHGMYHPILTNEHEGDIEYEISRSKNILEQKLNKTIFAFSYPNSNFNGMVKDKLRKYGYLCAFSTITGINDEKTDIFEIKRDGFFGGPIYVFGVKLAFFPLLTRNSWLFKKNNRSEGISKK